MRCTNTHLHTHTDTHTHTHTRTHSHAHAPMSVGRSLHTHLTSAEHTRTRKRTRTRTCTRTRTRTRTSAHHPWPGAIGARALRSLALVMPPYPSLPSDNVPEPKSYNFSLSLVPSAHTTAVSIVEKGAISKKSISRLTLLLKL